MQRWSARYSVFCTDRIVYFLIQRKNTRICLCGIRLYRIIPAGGHAGIQCSGNLHTAVFQKGWCGSGSSLRSADHYGERSCSRDNILWNELDLPDRDVPPGWLRGKCSYVHKNRQISEICRITEKLPIQKNSGSKDSGFFFTYKQKATIMRDTLCPFKTLQK